MNRTEHLLVIMVEELAELQQQVTKALRFGVHEQRDLPTSNHDRIQAEYNDLAAVIEMLMEEGVLDIYCDDARMAAKREKVEKYLKYSDECGTLQ